MPHSKGPKSPPKSFETLREAKLALTNLADSLSTHSFTWPAAAIRSYLKGKSKSLDEAFGMPEPPATPVKKKALAKAPVTAAKKKARR